MMSGLRQITRISTLAVMTTVVGLGPAAGLASGQERDRAQAQTRLEESLPEGAANRVRELSRELAEAGIPPQLIRRKAFEGVAKGVPPDRIMTALEAYSRRLQEAQGLLGPDRNGASLAAAAEAVRRGVPPEAIRGLARQGAGRRQSGPGAGVRARRRKPGGSAARARRSHGGRRSDRSGTRSRAGSDAKGFSGAGNDELFGRRQAQGPPGRRPGDGIRAGKGARHGADAAGP